MDADERQSGQGFPDADALLDDWESADLPLALEDRRVFLASAIGRGLHPRDLAMMMGEGYARLATAERGAILALEAQPQREFFLVLSGRLEVARSAPDGSRHILDVVGPGGACGGVTAFAPRPCWPAAVHVVEDARLLALTTGALLSDSAPDATRLRLLQNCVRMVAGRALHLRSQGEMLSRRGLRERLAFYLTRHADAAGGVGVTMTRQALADHLHVSRASMTRELGRMIDEQLISLRGRGFLILDADELRRLAG